MTDLAAALDRLQQLPPPPAPPWWPQTWGWAVAAALAVFVVVALAWRTLRRRHRNRYRREALRELARIQADTATRRHAARALPALLKRAGLSTADADRVRGLRGQEWVDYLQRTGGEPFPAGTAALLGRLAYGGDGDVASIPDASLRDLFEASRRWLERHHVAP